MGAATQADALAGQIVARLAPAHALHWRLIAQTGATTATTLARLQETAPEPFDVAVTALGVNDVTRGVPLGRWLDRQARLRAVLAERFAVGHVILTGLPPMAEFPALPQPLRGIIGMTARRFDASLGRAVAGLPGVTHLAFDIALTPALMASDGFHPGPAGYALWADRLAPVIARHAPRP